MFRVFFRDCIWPKKAREFLQECSDCINLPCDRPRSRNFYQKRQLSGISVLIQEHVSEYGVHWNFFFTLGVNSIAFALVKKLEWFTELGAGVAVMYQILLQNGLQDYILYTERTNLISANKEGIFSCLGYFSIFLISAGIGQHVLKPVNPKDIPNQRLRMLRLYAYYSMIFILLFILNSFCHLEISRRMVFFFPHLGKLSICDLDLRYKL